MATNQLPNQCHVTLINKYMTAYISTLYTLRIAPV